MDFYNLTLRKGLTFWIMIRYLINLVSMAVPTLLRLGSALTNPGVLRKPSLGALYLKYFQSVGVRKPSLGALYLKYFHSVGVQQGNMLGPLFVIIHINDLPLELISGVNSSMLADDTTILLWRALCYFR